ncbi:Glycine cleavage system P protein [Pleurostoma richardsiae]|uniref:Glycine cleavage system P protein n=1 Tax=Pleurostoma richardsiae TaxID=41990 RepID=A0AA38VWC3_9PEZI|nr:Glycine cleavage system P protein [Pleurostoma richardsiae]
MATNGLVVSRQLGRLARRAAGTPVILLAGVPAAKPWVCRSCSRGFSHFQKLPATAKADRYATLDTFPRRHIGPDASDEVEMLKVLDPPVKDLDEFVSQVIPTGVLSSRKLFAEPQSYGERSVDSALTEHEVLELGVAMAAKGNVPMRSFYGAGYYSTLTPEVIKRNVLENPAWYTSYTPYQPEISQGRLESLLNYQTLVSDLTGLPISNASLLDEGTAAAEALTLSMNALSSSRAKRPGKTFIVSHLLHPQTRAVLQSRAEGFGIKIETADVLSETFADRLAELGDDLVGVMVQYPDTKGGIHDFRNLSGLVHKNGALLSVATDLLALTVLTPPGEWGADVAFGNAQRFGVPMGFGGPHAAFFAVTEKHKRKMPGRLVGVSKDRRGGRALRLALQTREQHIRREKATSNVCTAQALLANISALYAVYHGPEGLKAIAERVMRGAKILQAAAQDCGYETNGPVLFDTVLIRAPGQAKKIVQLASEKDVHLRLVNEDEVGISIDEATTKEDLSLLVGILQSSAGSSAKEISIEALLSQYDGAPQLPEPFKRTSAYLTHPVFNSHHSETEILRYMYHLESKDLSLVHSMIPLGSCTMKLNGTVEMALITQPGYANVHPYSPRDKVQGYTTMLDALEEQLKSITAMDGVSLQPNSGAQGEFAGLRTIRKYHESQGHTKRDICLIPVSAHGTNPASAAMAGMRVVPIKCDSKTGNLDLADLEEKCKKHADQLGAMMITYPSTFGVFEPQIKEVCKIVHEYGGQVYMDGANMNAQIGLCSPGEIGADVCHLNLHKTFCIPHGGGGPGMGPICVKQHLVEHLPPKKFEEFNKKHPVSSAPYGSASILPISWAYNALMGADGLKHATEITILNANYILSRLKPHYKILYTNEHGRCAHEFILDARPFHDSAGIEAIDIAKRLQDYGFHAPTMSWPVANTLMIEPTESESKEELDRFIDALISIREEIREIEEGKMPREGNVLKMSPHPMSDIILGDSEEDGKWDRPYSRQKAAYPLSWLKEKKFWPTVARVDDTYGDLNLFCTCPPVEDTTGGNLSSV